MPPLTRHQARQIDRIAMEELGIPSVVLMENAGLNAVSAIGRFMAKQRGDQPAGRDWPVDARVVIFCGGGNNGGDGYVIARHLYNQGANVQIIALKPIDQLTGDAAVNAVICQNMALDIQPAPGVAPAPECSPAGLPVSDWSTADLLIDALLGTGFTGDLRPDLLEIIQTINATRDMPHAPTIVAIDLPSGLDCDTGQPPDNPPGNPAQDAIRADLTITFVAPKLGFNDPAAKPYLGRVVVADIGIPLALLDRLSESR